LLDFSPHTPCEVLCPTKNLKGYWTGIMLTWKTVCATFDISKGSAPKNAGRINGGTVRF